MRLMQKKLLASAVALSALASVAVVPTANAEVAATVSVANMYYWRGFDLGGGAALIADVNYSTNGFIAGIWTSSGDSAGGTQFGGAADGLGGTEYDLYAGYSGSVGDFTYGVSFVSYVYPTLGESTGDDTVPSAVKPGEYVEVLPTLGYGPFKATYYDAVVADHAPLGDEDYSYVTLELNFEKFAFKYGQHMDDADVVDGISHLDATYKHNDKLSFTLGRVVDDKDGFVDTELNFVATLSLPLM